MPRAKRKDSISHQGAPLQQTAAAIGSIVGASASLGNAAAVDPITQSLQYLSTNPWLAGIAYITLNLGGKHIAMNLTPEQEKLMSSAYVRPIIIFCLCFIASRNIVTAFWLTVLFILVFYVILYEGSPLCLLRVVPVEKTEAQAPSGQTQPPAGNTQPQQTQAAPSPNPSNPSQINVVPLFMRGPIAVPDTSIVTEELNYMANVKKI